MMDIRTIVIDNDKIYICCEEVHIQYSYRNPYCISTLVYIKLCGFRKQKYTNIYIYIYIHIQSILNRLQKVLEKQYLFRGSVRFQFVFVFVKSFCQETVQDSRYTIWVIFT